MLKFIHSLHPSDVNECALNQDACLVGQYCENTIGSYTCRRSISCGTGYTLDRSTQQCQGMRHFILFYFFLKNKRHRELSKCII